MLKLIEKIKENSIIIINNKKYNALTKTFYVTKEDVEKWYVKIVLSNHKILVFMPFDNLITLGEMVDDFSEGEYFPKNINYNKKQFKNVAEGYQIVTKIEFGDPLISEGEVYWADYISEDDETIDVNMAYVYRTKKRADIVSKFIEENEIQILN